MSENLAGLIKILGITVLLAVLWAVLASVVPESFLRPSNIENLIRRTALYGILGIGVAFVIISSGIDLSIGSLVCLTACLFALFLQVNYEHQGAIQTTAITVNTANVNSPIASDQFLPGSKLWYSVDLRNQQLLTVKQISGATITFEEEFGARSLNAKKQGVLIPVYPIQSLDGTNLVLEQPLAGLEKKDKLRFISPSSTTQNQPVAETLDGKTIQLGGELIGVNAENFYTFRSKRKPLMSIPLAVLSVLGIALALGLLHGVLITKFKQRPFIVTLCGLLGYRSISRVLTNDQTVGFGTEYSDSLSAFGEGSLMLWKSAETDAAFGIPYPFFIFLALIILALIFLNKTIWGRYMMALGRNEEAARYSGINTERMTILAYVLCAVLAGIGGILFALDSNSIAPSSFGNFFELYAIAAAVLGGCSLRGGEGSIIGVIVGTALMQTLYNSIVLLGIPDTWEYAIIAVVILLGVTSDELIRRIAGYVKAK